MILLEDKLIKFIVESDVIEWEEGREVNTAALQFFLTHSLNEENVLLYHKAIVGDEKRAGKYRDIQVYIGNHIPPAPSVVPVHMKWFFEDIRMMDSRKTHNRFEHIHPFQDFNGRIWRAIWLHIAMNNEGYNFEIPFLQKYYYQTLDSYQC